MNKPKTPNITLTTWSPDRVSKTVDRFLERPAFDQEAEDTARRVLKDIRMRGDAAVAAYAAEFDRANLKPSRFAVTGREREKARNEVDRAFKRAAEETYRRIVRFSRAGLRPNWSITSPKGGLVAEQFVPLDRVGVYIPGGAAPLVSTALMTAALAKVAGVPEIVACTPAGSGGAVNPYVLFALDLAGATEIYRVGGIQAVGAMAYGTRTIRRVSKIVGPGGPYVTAAKRLVYGDVDLDLVAGPSEIAVLADGSASPVHVAADLLSQAEHGTGHEKALLVTPARELAEAVRKELARQAETLARKEMVWKVLAGGTLLVVVEQLDAGMELCNRFAPEHFEIMVKEPRRWLPRVRNAGAVFLGPWSPEVAGDFVAGPSHVLPTGGTARMFSGLTVDSFRKRTSVISFTRADLKETLPVLDAFGRVEQLEGHARSARARFENI